MTIRQGFLIAQMSIFREMQPFKRRLMLMIGKRRRKRAGRVVLGREKERNERAEQILKELEEEKFK